MTPRATIRQPIPPQRVLRLGGLLALCASSLAAVQFFDRAHGNPHLNSAETITYSRIPFILVPMAIGPLCTLILFALAIGWSIRRTPGRWLAFLALGLSLFGHLALFVSWFVPNESWRVEDYVTGQDGRCYYFLHCPPPLNGPGHYAVARRLAGDLRSYTVRTVGRFDRYGTFEPYVDPSPPLIAAAKVLWSHWKSGKQRIP